MWNSGFVSDFSDLVHAVNWNREGVGVRDRTTLNFESSEKDLPIAPVAAAVAHVVRAANSNSAAEECMIITGAFPAARVLCGKTERGRPFHDPFCAQSENPRDGPSSPREWDSPQNARKSWGKFALSIQTFNARAAERPSRPSQLILRLSI